MTENKLENNIQKRPVWKLKKGFDRRFQSGHPWVFSNELVDSPKGILPGTPIELQNSSGQFLAYGFGNPQSLISFREVSRLKEDANWDSVEYCSRKFKEAFEFRKRLGLTTKSFRWIHGESDGFSGLIVDRYLLENRTESVCVIQCHSSGMDRITDKIIESLLKIDECCKTVVLRNDIQSRKLEGLEENTSIAVGKLKDGFEKVWMRSAIEGKEILFSVDLKKGQKTGFFLDQTDNIHSVISILLKTSEKNKTPLKILDLCTYVGQWGTQITHALIHLGQSVEVTLVDVSEAALKIAKKNVESVLENDKNSSVKTIAMDVLKQLPELKNLYDVIICDPPALIVNRKHHPVGIHAYEKLNREAMKLLSSGGVYVSCSCSQLLTLTDFTEVLSKAEKMSSSKIRWILEGSQAVDHPIRMNFPESHYLKMKVGIKE